MIWPTLLCDIIITIPEHWVMLVLTGGPLLPIIGIVLILPWLDGVLARRTHRQVLSRANRFLWAFIMSVLGVIVAFLGHILAQQVTGMLGERVGERTFHLLLILSFLLTAIAASAIAGAIADLKNRSRWQVFWLQFVAVVLGVAALMSFATGVERSFHWVGRHKDQVNLRGIVCYLDLYRDEKGHYPSNLRQLVGDMGIDPQLLIATSSYDACYNTLRQRPYQGPIDWVYFQLPENAPSDAIWIFQSPRFHDGEGAWVLYKSRNIKWLTAAELADALANAASQDRPTTAPAK
ncbi:MAG: hypothetical protein WC869_02925 [Phycisphaerae bacterium]|jgi:hypothetical protein